VVEDRRDETVEVEAKAKAKTDVDRRRHMHRDILFSTEKAIINHCHFLQRRRENGAWCIVMRVQRKKTHQ
jgi:hypothetical protein